MNIVIKPMSRVATPGRKVSFRVQVEEGDVSAVHVRPCEEAEEYAMHFEDGELTVQAPAKPSLACLDFFVEARDASGEIVASEHAEIITAQSWMTPAFVATAAAGLLVVLGSVVLTAGWLRVALATVGAIVGLVGVASVIFAVRGIYLGFPWHFTPEPGP